MSHLTDTAALLPDARALVIKHQRGSVSMVQRHLKIGYNAASELLELLQAEGVVGPINGEGGRQVLVSAKTMSNDAALSRLRDTQRVLVEALREAEKALKFADDKTQELNLEIEGEDLHYPIFGDAIASARAALASVEQQQEPSKTPFRLDPPPVYDQHYAATQSEVEQPEQPYPTTAGDEEVTAREDADAAGVPAGPVCPHGIHMDNACGACIPPRGTTVVAPASFAAMQEPKP